MVVVIAAPWVVEPTKVHISTITTVLKEDRGLRNDLKRTRSGFVVVVAI